MSDYDHSLKEGKLGAWLPGNSRVEVPPPCTASRWENAFPATVKSGSLSSVEISRKAHRTAIHEKIQVRMEVKKGSSQRLESGAHVGE